MFSYFLKEGVQRQKDLFTAKNNVYAVRRLINEGKFTPVNLVQQFKLIQEKLSDEPANIRQWIDTFIRGVIAQTVVWMDKNQSK
jgi:hypothetical protein